jgi:hypothetical protein
MTLQTALRLPDRVAQLLRDFGAPPRPAAHLRAVHDVACQLVDWIAQRHPALHFDGDAALFGGSHASQREERIHRRAVWTGSAHDDAGRELHRSGAGPVCGDSRGVDGAGHRKPGCLLHRARSGRGSERERFFREAANSRLESPWPAVTAAAPVCGGPYVSPWLRTASSRTSRVRVVVPAGWRVATVHRQLRVPGQQSSPPGQLLHLEVQTFPCLVAGGCRHWHKVDDPAVVHRDDGAFGIHSRSVPRCDARHRG